MYDPHSAGALNYYPCRYGQSRVVFRGPKRSLERPFCVAMGGSETYGKYIKAPFPALLEQATGHRVVNLGVVNAGVDVFAGDDTILNAARRAQVSIVQVLGAQNMSNRFYSVHPRRNDRFLKASAILRAMYREVDFTEMHFTRHMLRSLMDVSPERFEIVRDELKTAWLARMKLLASKLPGKSVLLWMAKRRPEDDHFGVDLDADPLFVDRTMMDALRPHFDDFVEVVAPPVAQADQTGGMVVPELEVPVAAHMAGPSAHQDACDVLMPVVDQMML